MTDLKPSTPPAPSATGSRLQPAAATSPWPRALGAAAAAGLLTGSVPLLWAGTPWPAALGAAVAAAAVAGAAAWTRSRPVGAPVPGEPPAALPAPALPADAMLRDPQTGMFLRAAFLALAERDWQRAARYGGAVALLLIEIDRLRSLTEQAGPAVADHLLGGLARQVLRSLRGADLLARFDDAQLAVFLPHADPTGALDVADRIRAHVEHLELPGLPPGAPITASIGVALLRPLHEPMSTLLADAHRALQQARQAGGNCVRLAAPDTVPPLGAPGSWVGGGDPVPPSRDA